MGRRRCPDCRRRRRRIPIPHTAAPRWYRGNGSCPAWSLVPVVLTADGARWPSGRPAWGGIGELSGGGAADDPFDFGANDPLDQRRQVLVQPGLQNRAHFL